MRTPRNRPRTANRSTASAAADDESAVAGAREMRTENNDAGADREGRRPFEHSHMDAAPAFTSADFRPEFRISMQPMPGGTKTPKPALLDDWKSAVVDAAAKEAAMDEMQPFFENAQAQAAQALGRPLERRDLGSIRKPIIAAHMRPLRAKYFQAMSKDAGSRAQTVDDTLVRHGARMQTARDPFMPLALGDPAARAKDRVLWENSKVMVLVDSFSPMPKALVVPKTPAMFPTDLSDADLEEIAEIARKVSDAFGQAAGAPPSKIWINPPQRLTVKQLHCHVLPGLQKWEPEKQNPRDPVPPAVIAEQNQFYSKLEGILDQQL